MIFLTGAIKNIICMDDGFCNSCYNGVAKDTGGRFMAQKDMAEKLLADYNDVFADIVNVLLFDGKEVVQENDLVDTKAKSAACQGQI